MMQASKDPSALEVQYAHGSSRASSEGIQEFQVAVFQGFQGFQDSFQDFQGLQEAHGVFPALTGTTCSRGRRTTTTTTSFSR